MIFDLIIKYTIVENPYPPQGGVPFFLVVVLLLCFWFWLLLFLFIYLNFLYKMDSLKAPTKLIFMIFFVVRLPYEKVSYFNFR